MWELHERGGRATDAPWKYRNLLTCAGDRLSLRQPERLQETLAEDVELAVAWGIKEHVRQVIAASGHVVAATGLGPAPGSRTPRRRRRTTAKTIKQVRRRYGNHRNYKSRFIGYAPRRSRREHPAPRSKSKSPVT